MRLNKGYQLEHVDNCLNWMTKYGMHPHLTIMVGILLANQRTTDQTVSEVKRLMFFWPSTHTASNAMHALDYTPYHKEMPNGRCTTDR